MRSFNDFAGLSIGDNNSVCDSEFSRYNPSVYDYQIPVDAEDDERAMHEFLDSVGVYQINVKVQIESEKRTVFSASPNLSQTFRMKQSPSFMLKRRERFLSNNGQSTKGSSNGTKS